MSPPFSAVLNRPCWILRRRTRRSKHDWKITEESKLRNHHEEEEEHFGDSGGRSSINPFHLLNEGDEDADSDKEIEIDDDTIVEKKHEDVDDDMSSRIADNAQPVSKNKSKKKKNKESASIVAKAQLTLQALSLNTKEEVEETKAHADSSKKASSRSVLEIDPKYLNLENELWRIYGSKAVRSFETSGSSRQGRGGRRGIHHITKTLLISPMENWSRWD